WPAVLRRPPAAAPPCGQRPHRRGCNQVDVRSCLIGCCGRVRPHGRQRAKLHSPKDRVLYVWQQRTSEVKDRATEVKRRAKAVQQKLDRLDEAFLYAQTIDPTSY